MEINQAILMLPTFVIWSLFGFFLVRPVHLLNLAWDRSLYFAALVACSLFIAYSTTRGFRLAIEISMIFAVLLTTAIRLPVLRFIEKCPGDGEVRINRIVHRHFWPSSYVRARSCYHAYRTGLVAGVLPYVDMIDGFQYVYGGRTYDSLKDLEGVKPTVVLHAEHALLKTLQ